MALRPDVSDILKNLKERIRVLEALVGAAPAEFQNTWRTDGTDLATLVHAGRTVLRGWSLSSQTDPFYVAFYDLADEGDIEDDLVPQRTIRIPEELAANMDGAGVVFEDGLCFATWATLDSGAGWDFDGDVAAGVGTISLWWDEG